MITNRTVKDKNYTVTDNAMILDERLSAKAKGIFIYLLSLHPDWDLYVIELVAHFTDGIDGIRSGLKELQALGYVDWKMIRDSEGKSIGTDYTLNEKPDMENPDMAKPTLLSTNNKVSTNKDIVATESQRRIIQHLNDSLGKKPPKGFKMDNQRCLKDLNARLRQYSEADIIAVIDIKCEEWLGTNMQKYIRPITLFNVNKFESYVNEIDVEGSQNEIHALKELE